MVIISQSDCYPSSAVVSLPRSVSWRHRKGERRRRRRRFEPICAVVPNGDYIASSFFRFFPYGRLLPIVLDCPNEQVQFVPRSSQGHVSSIRIGVFEGTSSHLNDRVKTKKVSPWPLAMFVTIEFGMMMMMIEDRKIGNGGSSSQLCCCCCLQDWITYSLRVDESLNSFHQSIIRSMWTHHFHLFPSFVHSACRLNID